MAEQIRKRLRLSRSFQAFGKHKDLIISVKGSWLPDQLTIHCHRRKWRARRLHSTNWRSIQRNIRILDIPQQDRVVSCLVALFKPFGNLTGWHMRQVLQSLMPKRMASA